MRHLLRRVLVVLPACGLLVAAACARSTPSAAGPIEIAARPAAAPADRSVTVTGLSSEELRALTDAKFDEAQWQALLRVGVSGADLMPVIGRYAVTASGIEFRPAFPFDAGRRYTVAFDPARLPSPRSEPSSLTEVSFPGPSSAASSTMVTGVDPSATTWPENMLRFYIHFSAPMSRGQGTRHVHLVDDAGREVADAILAAYADLWNPEATRLTVFFDPGRVKRGVGPNVSMGRAIVAGRRYAIVVDAAWPDAQGQPLRAAFRREFLAGPPAYEALDVGQWRVTPPAIGSRDPLVVRFPAPLDHALLERAIGVELPHGARAAGRAAAGPSDHTWTFVPDVPWVVGRHQLVALTILEDPAGNKIGRAFEVLSGQADAAPTPEAELVRVPFEIR